MTKTIRALALILFWGFCGERSSHALEPPPRPVHFSSAVNWEFPKLEKLDAWRNTAVVLKESLGAWYPPIPGEAVENTPPETLRAFLAGLPKREPGSSLSLVYVASHQTRGGRWLFPREVEQSWTEILANGPGRAEIPRLLIVDACFAEAAEAGLLAKGLGATGIFYTSGRAEEAHEVNFRLRFPVDLQKRYPAEAKWLREHLGKEWNGRVSFFGFIWVQAFLATPQGPRTTGEWEVFFRKCETLAREFRQGRGAALATTFQYVTAAGQ